MGTTHICGPFPRAAQYRAYVDDPAQYRQYLTQMLRQYPELFPKDMDQDCTLHDCYLSVKQDLLVRRIKVKATGAVFALRPSFVMPSMIGRTEEVEQARALRQWGVSLDALASVVGRDAMFWYRAWLACGRPALLGTTVKDLQPGPTALVADEQVTWVAGQEVSIPTTVGGGCCLGGSVVAAADTAALETGDGECAQEARALAPAYQPRAVCPDGWHATREAWRRLFPTITLVRCLLHAVLKIQARCRGALRYHVLDRVWRVYQAPTKRQFAQRLRRLAEWTPAHRRGAVAEMVLQLCRRRADFPPAYDGPQAHRPSNAVDRLLTAQDRGLYAMRYCHATTASARLAVRAMALQWNCHPYGPRLRRDQPMRVSPFHDLNGFQYHPNWLHNLLIASSLGGLRL
jgi:hypothetical protein